MILNEKTDPPAESNICGGLFGRASLVELFNAAVDAAKPESCMPRHLPLPLPANGRTVVIGAGKAAASMAQVLESNLCSPIEGFVVTRYGHAVECRDIIVREAQHPISDDSAMQSARRILDIAKSLGPDDLLICLISGGGSALLSLPIQFDDGRQTLDFSEKQQICRALLNSGASISEINTVRRHLSSIKGGRLTKAAYPARLLTLAISDVPGDDVATIASGPTAPDPTTCGDALKVLRDYEIPISQQVHALLASGEAETPKPGDPVFENSLIKIVCKPSDALKAAESMCRSNGFDVMNLGDRIEGESSAVGKEHARLALDIQGSRNSDSRPLVILSGGETSVTVRGSGKGGRNVEYLLSLTLELDGAPNICAIACDTDGIDGSEDNAGAFCDANTLRRAKSRGLRADRYLDNNDAYSFFELLNDLIVTGPTLTNVNDFRAIMILARGTNGANQHA